MRRYAVHTRSANSVPLLRLRMAKPQNGGKVVHTEEQQKAVVLSPIHLEAARFSNFNCLAGNFGECAAGFKIENYFTGAELLPSAGGCTVLFIACERTADR